MLRKVFHNYLLAAVCSFFISSPLMADPIKLFPAIEGSINNQTGKGLACLVQPGADDILIGSPGVSTAPGDALVISGQDGSTQLFSISESIDFGTSAAALGDLNSDNIGDFVVGAPQNGDADVFLSSSPGIYNQIPLPRPTAPFFVSASHFFGNAVSKVDGSSNLVAVGAPGFAISVDTDGIVLFYNALTGAFDYGCPGQSNSGERFGSAIANIGDLNNDGVADLLVGAPDANAEDGRVVALSVGSGAACTELYSVATGVFDQLGSSVSSVGDVNSDGVEDFVAGGVSDTPNGVAVLYSGINGSSLCTIRGAAGERLGSAVSGIGDANYDSLPDFAVGAPGADSGNGRVYIYSFNQSTQSCSLIYTISGTAPQTGLGSSIAGGSGGAKSCDMNQDSYPEFLVSSSNGTAGSGSGAAIVFSIPTPTPTPTATATATPTVTLTLTASPTATIAVTATATARPARTSKPAASPTPLLPNKSEFSFRISQDGRFVASNTLKFVGNISKAIFSSRALSVTEPDYGSCRVQIFGRYSASDLSSRSNTFRISSNKIARRITRFTAGNLSKVQKDPALKKPYILHLIAKNTCNSRVFYSNVASRYLNCGKEPEVAVDSFINNLSTVVK